MRQILAVLFMLCAFIAQAQTPAPRENTWQSALRVIKTGWNRVVHEGRPAAERLVKAAPEKYKDIQSQVTRFTEKLAHMPEAKVIEEKRALLVELWRIRASLDLLSLLAPENLHAITGIEPEKFNTLRANYMAVFQRWTQKKTLAEKVSKN